MALEQPYRTALIATRARCAQILAPLADRLIYDLRNYHDREGGGFLTVELVAALDGLPNGREKIMRLWEEMTRKGTRGWRALMCILERMNPDVRRHLEEAAEQARMPSDSGYASPSSTPVVNQCPYVFHQPVHPAGQDEAGVLPGHYPMPRDVAINDMHNEDMEVQTQLMDQVPQPAPQFVEYEFHRQQARHMHEDPERESSGAMEDELLYRNTALSAIDSEAKSILATVLNKDKELVVHIGQELQASPEVLTQCRRVNNSSGFLFSQLNDVTVQDLCKVLEGLGMWGLSHKLLQGVH